METTKVRDKQNKKTQIGDRSNTAELRARNVGAELEGGMMTCRLWLGKDESEGGA